tara:strand:- start:2435 stop:3565 length:1131 start_codon:yes stop_codon:yes gene_type:complete
MDPGETAGVRVLPPPDGEFYISKTHGFPAQPCTADLPGFDGKCVYCFYNEVDRDFRDKYYPSVRTVACVVDFRYFHWDMTGDKPVVHVCADAAPAPKRVRCRHCKGTNEEISKRRFGGQKRWELTDDQRDQLGEVNSKLQLVCVAQSDPDDPDSVCEHEIDILGYQCGAEGCEELIISERDMETHDISDALSEEYECETCGETAWLDPIMVCMSETTLSPRSAMMSQKLGGLHATACEHDAEPGSIFGRIVEVTCSGRQVKTRGGKERTRKSYNFDRNVAPWSKVEEDLAAFGFDDEEIKAIATHDDLVKRFAPFRLDPSEYGGEEEYVSAVLGKQLERINERIKNKGDHLELPDGWSAKKSGKSSTGAAPWRRRK